MKTNLIRTLLALLISVSGIVFTQYYLLPNTGAKNSNANQVAMAKVSLVVNDVKKQGVNKLIWEPVRKGDLLYLGEKLKTSALSNSKIEFIENGTSIDIEPESLIVISKNDKKLSLKVVEGSLFVDSKQNVGDLSVTTGNSNQSLNLKNSNGAFSVSKDGKAEMIGGNLDDKFKEVKPIYNETLFVDPQNKDGILFKWKPLEEIYKIKIEIGESRNQMQTPKEMKIDPLTGIISIKPIFGTYYWKLIAENSNDPNDKFSSSTFKVTYKQKLAPIPVYPPNNDIVQIRTTQDPIEFKWSLLHSFEKTKIEIYNESSPETPLVSEDVSTQTFFSTKKISKAGKYSWKLVGNIQGDEQSLNSPMQTFDLVIGDELPSPILLTPEDKAQIFYPAKTETGVSNLQLSWKEVKDASEYLITIKNKDNVKKEFKTPRTEFTIPKLTAGAYTWSVQSINIKSQVSKMINSKNFNITPMGNINFKPMIEKVFYVKSFPQYKFEWTKYSGTSQYRLKISQNQTMTPNELMKTKDDFFQYQIGKDGIYFATVEALNNQDEVIAESAIFTFTVAKPPLPVTPLFSEDKRSNEANLNGDIGFLLTNHEKNLQVIFEIIDEKGSVINQQKSIKANAIFRNLNPGNYFVVAKYIDEYEQISEPSLKKSFIVPDRSSIAAPKIKGVKVR